MSDAILLTAALSLATIGMAACALTISAHWRQFFDRPHPRAMLLILRIAGALTLLASFSLCAMADPILMVILVWPMLLMIGAGIVAATLSVRARLARHMLKASRLPPLTGDKH